MGTENPGGKALQIARSSLPNLRDPQSVRAALADRLTLSESLEIVAHMLRGYDRQTSDGYMGAIAETLCRYPRCVAARAGDVVDGVPGTTKFLPTPADVIAWCEREAAQIRTIATRNEQWEHFAEQVNERDKLEREAAQDRSRRPTYDDLKTKYGPDWGITNPDRKPVQSPAQARAELISDIGQEAFDALPNAKDKPPNGCGKLRAPQREAAE